MIKKTKIKIMVKPSMVLMTLLGLSVAFLFMSVGMALAVFSINIKSLNACMRAAAKPVVVQKQVDASVTPKDMVDVQLFGDVSQDVKTVNGKQIMPGDYMRVSLTDLLNGNISRIEPSPAPAVCGNRESSKNCDYDCPNYCICRNNPSTADGCPQHCDCPMVGTGPGGGGVDLPSPSVNGTNSKFWVRYW